MKLGILGHFGIGKSLLNGQTVKSNNLADGLERYTSCEVLKIDTHGWTRAPFKLLHNIKNAFRSCDAVIMLPAHNGVRVFAPILLHYKKKYRKKIYYDVIGGWLPEFIENKKNLKKTLKGFDGIWTETDNMRSALESQAFQNVKTVPNFKELSPLSKDKLDLTPMSPYKLCTFSRVMKEKGIATAVQVVSSVNQELGENFFTLDIYGQVDPSQTEWFDELQQSFPEQIKYCGAADPSSSVDVLSGYFALLFPTYYDGEGFAGTIIDAYAAGLPVIASDWRYNSELVTDDTGFLFPTEDKDAFAGLLKTIAKEPSIVTSKKPSCLAEAEKYRTENVIKQIEDILNQ